MYILYPAEPRDVVFIRGGRLQSICDRPLKFSRPSQSTKNDEKKKKVFNKQYRVMFVRVLRFFYLNLNRLTF